MDENKLLEERYNYVEQRRNVGEWFRKRMSWIILVIASVLFIFKEGLEFSQSQDDVLTLIMSMGLTYFFALYVSISMRRLGKKGAKESNSYINVLKYLSEAKKSIKDIMYLLPIYTNYKNKKALENVKKLFLEENGIVFKLYEKGFYDKKETKEMLLPHQLKALKNVHQIKITQLQSNELLSDHSSSRLKYLDPLFLGIDEKTDSKTSSRNMIISKAIFPIITSYFAIQVVLGSNLLWGAIQVSIIMLMGVTHFLEGEDYVLNELKNRQINKADLLIEFKNLHDKKHDLFQEFEYVEEKIIQQETT